MGFSLMIRRPIRLFFCSVLLLCSLQNTIGAISLTSGAFLLGASSDSAKKPDLFVVQKNEFRKRGIELGNFVYEVFDPNAIDPLKEPDPPEKGMKLKTKLWIAGSALGLLGAGVGGYIFWGPKTTKVNTHFVDYCDKKVCLIEN